MSLKEKVEAAGSKVLNWMGKIKDGKKGRFVPCHEFDLETFIDSGISAAAIKLYLYVMKELSKDYLDFGSFNISSLAKILKTDRTTIKNALVECHENNLIWNYSLGKNKGKIIFLAKKENLQMLSDIEKGILKIDLQREERLSIGNLVVRSYAATDNKVSSKVVELLPVADNTSTSSCVELLPLPTAETIETTTNTATLLEPLQEPFIKNQQQEPSLEKISIQDENLISDKVDVVVDFKKFLKEEENNNKSEMVINQVSEKIESEQPNLTHAINGNALKVSSPEPQKEKVAAAAVVSDQERLDKILDVAVTVEYMVNGSLQIVSDINKNSLGKKLKECLELGIFKNLDELELVVTEQKDAFKYRIFKASEMSYLASIYVNCLSKKRDLPESYLSEKKKIESKQDLEKYSEIIQIWGLRGDTEIDIINSMVRKFDAFYRPVKEYGYEWAVKTFNEKIMESKKVQGFMDFMKKNICGPETLRMIEGI